MRKQILKAFFTAAFLTMATAAAACTNFIVAKALPPMARSCAPTMPMTMVCSSDWRITPLARTKKAR